MIILLDPLGQTSNHFIQHVRYDTFCKEYGIKYYSLPMVEYLNDFPKIKLFCNNRYIAKLVYIIFLALNRFSLVTYLDFTKPEIGKEYSQKPNFFKGKIVFCRGWFLQEPELFKKYRDDYQAQMQPKVDEAKLAPTLDLEGQEILVGIHIRRGDFKIYRGGEFYFDDQTYFNYIEQIAKLTDKTMKVILFTNDKEFNLDFYKDRLPCVVQSKYSVPEDYYLMSKCDYLLSTISTFPQWTSYISGAKLHRVATADEVLALDMFKEVEVIY